jgi:hypothetical protein
MSYIKMSLEIYKDHGLNVLLPRTVNFFKVAAKRYFGKAEFEEKYKLWGALKDSKKGKTAFIVGNGPSLNVTPLYLLNGEDTFCFNRINIMFPRLNWRPTYYMITDDLVAQDMKQEIPEILPLVDKAFFPDLHPSNIDFRKIIDHVEGKTMWLDTTFPGFSKALPKCGINKSVAVASIQIAAYLGYEKICLLGVDVNYAKHNVEKKNSREWVSLDNDDANHFDPNYFGKGRAYHDPSTESMIQKFNEANDFFSDEIEFLNVGIGGNLNYYKRSSIQQALGLNDEVVLGRFVVALPQQITKKHVQFLVASTDTKLVINESHFLIKGEITSDMVKGYIADGYKVTGPFADIFAVYR